MKYKVLALDLDGTLTNSEKIITPRTKAALQEAARRGVCIVLASGRPTVGIQPLARELELEKFGGCILSYNGGKIIDLQGPGKRWCSTFLSARSDRAGLHFQPVLECGASDL